MVRNQSHLAQIGKARVALPVLLVHGEKTVGDLSFAPDQAAYYTRGNERMRAEEIKGRPLQYHQFEHHVARTKVPAINKQIRRLQASGKLYEPHSTAYDTIINHRLHQRHRTDHGRNLPEGVYRSNQYSHGHGQRYAALDTSKRALKNIDYSAVNQPPQK